MPRWQYGFQGRFFSGLGVEITLKTGASLERGIDFHILMKIAPGALWDIILGAFWVPLGAFWWFGRVLGTGWNFDVFQGGQASRVRGQMAQIPLSPGPIDSH